MWNICKRMEIKNEKHNLQNSPVRFEHNNENILFY